MNIIIYNHNVNLLRITCKGKHTVDNNVQVGQVNRHKKLYYHILNEEHCQIVTEINL